MVDRKRFEELQRQYYERETYDRDKGNPMSEAQRSTGESRLLLRWFLTRGRNMVSRRTAILLGVASLLMASFACAGSDSKPVALTPIPQEQGVPTASNEDATLSTTVPAPDSNVAPSSNVDDKPEPSVAAPIQPKPGAGKDLTDAQHKRIDAQIAELRKSPDVLSECARENGDSVPAPGSAGEIEWYAAAAIKYAACASSKTTGLDWGK